MQTLERNAVSGDRHSTPYYPRHVFAWLPFLWSRVLFPGPSCVAEPMRLGSLALLLVLPGLLLYGCLSFHLFEPDEGRYAEIPREMLLRGEWVVPYLQGQPYLDKPPLLYWLVNFSYRVFGIHEWSARLVPALAIHACILLTYFFGLRTLGERAAFWGAVILALAPGFVSIGRLLVLDGLLSLWVALSLFAAFEAVRGERLQLGWWLLAAAACGLGILTKGPVALLLLVFPVWAYRRLTPACCPISWRALLLFAVLLMVIILPWYVAICVKLPGFARHFLWQHNVVRFLTPFDHLRPIWFYGPVLLAGLFPGSLLLFPFLRFLFSGEAESIQKRSRELGYMVLAGGCCVLFFSLSGSKLPTYILPAFPPLALALGSYLVASHWSRARLPALVAQMAFVFLCVGHNFVLPWYAGYRAPTAHLAELRTYCGDKGVPVVCYPRNCDSAAFYVGRDDLQNYRSKQTHLLVRYLQDHQRTVLLLTHRHSLQGLEYALTPDLHIVDSWHSGLGGFAGLPEHWTQNLTWLMGETSLGLCDIVVVERRPNLDEAVGEEDD